VRWWVILLFVVVAVAVFRHRQRNADRASLQRDGATGPAVPAATRPTARFHWGDAVNVADDSLGPARRGTRGLIVEVADDRLLTYRVEFADGATEIVRESSLEPVEQATG